MVDHKSVIVSNVFWKFAERIMSQLVSVVISIILARILAPDDYGVVSMVTVFVTIANVFVTFGIPNALIQKKDADQIDFSSCFYFNVIFSVAIYIMLFWGAPYIAQFYKVDILKPIIRVMGLRIVVASVNSIQHSYVARHMIFKKYFLSTLLGTMVSGIVGVTFAYMGFGVWALVVQYMTNTVIDTIVLFLTVRWRPTLQFSMHRVKELFRYGWKILFEGLSNTTHGELVNLIIGKVYTTADLAYYTKAQQFPSLIVNTFTSSIGAVLFPAMSDQQDDKSKVLSMLRKSVRLSTYVVYPLLFGLAVVAKPFVLVVLTEKWAETIPFMIAFCLLNLPTVGMIPRHQALNGTGRSDVFMNEHVVARVVSIILLVCTYKISIWAILIGGTISTLILVGIIAYTSKKYNEYSYKDQLFDILPTLVGCLIMVASVYCVRLLNLSNIFTLIIQVVLGGIVYLTYSKVMHLEEFEICQNYCINIIRKKNNK